MSTGTRMIMGFINSTLNGKILNILYNTISIISCPSGHFLRAISCGG
jgi:hypothetical protein